MDTINIMENSVRIANIQAYASFTCRSPDTFTPVIVGLVTWSNGKTEEKIECLDGIYYTKEEAIQKAREYITEQLKD